MDTAAVVLAAGGGSRFAGPGHKLVQLWRGEPLVTHAVRAAAASAIGPTWVVGGAVDLAPLLPAGVELLHNPDWAAGLATSLQVAVAHAAAMGLAAVVVGLGDQPMVGAAAWSAVAGCGSAIAVATYGGSRRNPVRLAREVWGLLPAGGDEGARGLVRRRPDLVSEVACDGDPADIDTLEDLDRWN